MTTSVPEQPGIGKRRKGKGPATKRQQRARRERLERAELEERARRRRFFSDRYDR